MNVPPSLPCSALQRRHSAIKYEDRLYAVIKKFAAASKYAQKVSVAYRGHRLGISDGSNKLVQPDARINSDSPPRERFDTDTLACWCQQFPEATNAHTSRANRVSETLNSQQAGTPTQATLSVRFWPAQGNGLVISLEKGCWHCVVARATDTQPHVLMVQSQRKRNPQQNLATLPRKTLQYTGTGES